MKMPNVAYYRMNCLLIGATEEEIRSAAAQCFQFGITCEESW